jgi:hypothetical protein
VTTTTIRQFDLRACWLARQEQASRWRLARLEAEAARLRAELPGLAAERGQLAAS